MKISRMSTPTSREEFEYRFYILYEGFKNGNFSIPAELGCSVKKLRYLPNRRANLLSIDERSRLFANMASQDIDLT